MLGKLGPLELVNEMIGWFVIMNEIKEKITIT